MAYDILNNDCVFYRVTNKIECAALRSRECGGCKFRKTEGELEAGRQKATKRLKRLPPRIFNGIMLKYYRFNNFKDEPSSEGEDED